VVFRLGRLLPVRGPGLVALIPVADRMVRVDLRTVTMTIPPQEVITRDNVPARVAAVCYFRVVDPAAAVTGIEAFAPATSQIAQTTLRSVLGRADLDQLLSERDRLNEDLQKIIDEQTEPCGIKVTTVEIKDVEIPASPASPRRCTCATCRPCSKWAPIRTRPSSSRCPSTCSGPSSTPRGSRRPQGASTARRARSRRRRGTAPEPAQLVPMCGKSAARAAGQPDVGASRRP
jgi:hypothetical protein